MADPRLRAIVLSRLWRFVVVAMLSVTSPGQAADWFVPTDFPTLQAAIDFASDGDSVLVAPGTYFETVDFLGKAIELRSLEGADLTIIDAEMGGPGPTGSVVTFANGEGPATKIVGFTLTGGTGVMRGSISTVGGGVFIAEASPSIEQCKVIGNAATLGGGLFISSGSEPAIHDCLVEGNNADRGGGVAIIEASAPSFDSVVLRSNVAAMQGGGLYAETAECHFTDSEFELNTASQVGGGSCSVNGGPYRFDACRFLQNSALQGGAIYGDRAFVQVTGGEVRQNAALSGGGGIFFDSTSFSTLEAVLIVQNEAVSGGGLFVVSDFPRVTNCRFEGNVVSSLGGGVALVNSGGVFAGNLIVDNQATAGGAGLYAISGSATLSQNTIAGNSSSGVGAVGGGIFLRNTSIEVSNSLVWGNSSPEFANVRFQEPGAPSFRYCNLEDGWGGAGAGNFEQNPFFVDPAAGDYSLAWVSPCINRGDPDAIPGGLFEDIDLGPRVVCQVVDVGAEEVDFSPTECPPVFVRGDCDRTGQLDLADPLVLASAITVGGALTCPDACDANDDGLVDIADVVFGLGALFVAGADLPPAPFPNCGVDLVLDALLCGGLGGCP